VDSAALGPLGFLDPMLNDDGRDVNEMGKFLNF
jgi:hypothetical protein